MVMGMDSNVSVAGIFDFRSYFGQEILTCCRLCLGINQYITAP